VLTVIRCKIVQQIIKYKKTENILSWSFLSSFYVAFYLKFILYMVF
jgi:hypothetical protein